MSELPAVTIARYRKEVETLGDALHLRDQENATLRAENATLRAAMEDAQTFVDDTIAVFGRYAPNADVIKAEALATRIRSALSERTT